MSESELYSGRYEILTHLARGGMAEVYMARDHLLDRPVALKVLFPEYARDDSFVERFRREAKSVANLNHPNIVAVYDWGEEAGTYFIVMEYVEGQSLRDLVHDEGTLLPERAAEVAADVAAALGYAHRHGVIHRDVKPGNILITPQGQVKVTDFGIAVGAADGQLTRTGMVMGTASYFSPEQAQGQGVDPRSDVYSLGIVLYEMVCGEPPFGGDDPVAIAYQHVREEPMPPGIKNPDVPLDLERVVLTALTKAPGDRYPSAEDFREDLLRFAQGQPVHSRPVTAVYADDDATTVGAAADATAVSGAVGAGGAGVGAGAPPPGREDRPAPQRRPRTAFWLTLVLLLLAVAGLAFLLADALGAFDSTETVAVPPVEGLQLEEARSQLEELGFEVEADFQENDDVPENQVFGQDPESGAKAEEGSTVTLLVSQGVGTTEVPDVVDRQRDDAAALLEGEGFEVESVEEFSDDVDEGRVIRTEPPPEVAAPNGSTVRMFVSSGVEPVTIPHVEGRDGVEAAAELAGDDFQVETVREPHDSVPEGEVIRTEPPGGETAPKGSTVRMIVSSGPEPVTVPEVINDPEDTAREKIEEAGLEPVKQTTTDCDLADDGRVVAQSPEGGEEADPGDSVVIVVCELPTSGGGDGGDGGGDGGGGGSD